MNRVFAIVDARTQEVVKTKKKDKNPVYTSLSFAKTAAKNKVQYENRKKKVYGDEKSRYEDYQVVEYELVEKERHKL